MKDPNGHPHQRLVSFFESISSSLTLETALTPFPSLILVRLSSGGITDSDINAVQCCDWLLSLPSLLSLLTSHHLHLPLSLLPGHQHRFQPTESVQFAVVIARGNRRKGERDDTCSMSSAMDLSKSSIRLPISSTIGKKMKRATEEQKKDLLLPIIVVDIWLNRFCF
jgi:hypothetical protein